MSNDPATIGRKMVSRVLAPLVLALTLLVPASADAALAPQGGKLTVPGSHWLGQAVALSADGALALAGAPGDDAVRVLARSGGTWADTGSPLLPAVGPDAAGFGSAVALSADGSVALVGAPSADDTVGAAWLFVRSGGSWTQAGRLTGVGEDGYGQFGAGVALSADGSVAVVSAPLDGSGAGAVWVFVRTGATWQVRGTKLVATGAVGAPLLGRAVAVSGDGATVVAGGPSDAGGAGAVWVFARGGDGLYRQDGAKLAAAGSAGLGSSVAVDPAVATVLVGGPADGAGAAYVFVRSSGTYVQQGPKLTATGTGAGKLGSSVALSADGATAMIGAPADSLNRGAAWRFERSGTTWIQREQLAPAPGTGEFATAVALAADGHTALIGGPKDGSGKGAVWAFAEAPTVTSISPALGTVTGGTAVTITGIALAGAATVRFGATPAPAVQVDSPTQLTAVAPPGTIGSAAVTVETSGGTAAAAQSFAYADVPGAPTGVGAVAGDGIATVAFTAPAADGGRPVDGYVVTIAPGGRTVEAAASPAVIDGLANGTAVTFTVRARNAIGLGPASAASSAVTPAAPVPAVTGLSVHEGPAAGGTVVAVTGDHLTGATAVRFGTVPAAFAVDDDGHLTATAPAHDAGDVHVTVTGPGGSSPATDGDLFAYHAPPPPDPPAAPVVTAVSAHLGGIAGGAILTVTGSHLGGATAVRFGDVPAAFAVEDDARITVTAPPHAAGQVQVTATTAGGTSATTCATAFSYLPAGGETLPPHRCAVAYPLHSAGTGRTPHAVALSVPDGGEATLLTAGGAAVTELAAAEGRYVLDVAHGVLTFTPARGFAGTAAAIRYRVHGDEATEATGTYTATVGLPAAPVATALVSTGAAGVTQHATVGVPDDTDVTLLDPAGNPVATVLAAGEGRYDLDRAAGTITFRPAVAFTGRGHGVRYRLSDAYGRSAVGAYVPTVVAGPVVPPVRVRVTTAPLNVAGPDGEVTLGCGVTAGTLTDCRIALVADVLGRAVVIGSGFTRSIAATGDVLVTVRLGALGRDLTRQPGGVAVRATASAAVTGRTAHIGGSVALHAVARAFVLRHAVRFGARAALLRGGERAYLDALAGALAGVRKVECIGTARDVRPASRGRLARARARTACAYLRARLPRTTVLTARAAGRADHRDPDRRVDLLVRY